MTDCVTEQVVLAVDECYGQDVACDYSVHRHLGRGPAVAYATQRPLVRTCGCPAGSQTLAFCQGCMDGLMSRALRCTVCDAAGTFWDTYSNLTPIR